MGRVITDDEVVEWFQNICYCGFLTRFKEQNAPSLCIHCKTLETLMEKDFVKIPDGYKPKTKPIENKLKGVR